MFQKTMLLKFIWSASFFILGLISAQLFSGTNPRETTSPTLSDTIEIDHLSSEEAIRLLAKKLEQANLAQKVMQQQIVLLSKRLDNFEPVENASNTANLSPQKLIKPNDGADSETQPIANDTPLQRAKPPLTRRQALVMVGVPPESIDEIIQIADKKQMAELYLRDRALREGWLNSARYQNELNQIREEHSIQNRLTEQQYDQYLYQQGRANRIMAQRVMKTSPADQAGIKDGDFIISYNGKHLYSWRDLRNATSSGSPGTMVNVEIQRGSERLNFSVPSGPLGVEIREQRVTP